MAERLVHIYLLFFRTLELELVFSLAWCRGRVCSTYPGNHGIIASKRCNDVSIQNNVVYDNLNAGIMLHRSSDHAVVRNNTISGSGDSCIAIFESMGEEGDHLKLNVDNINVMCLFSVVAPASRAQRPIRES